MTTRWRMIRDLWQQNQWLLVLSGWVIGILTLPMLQAIGTDILGFINDLVPEAVGILFTVLIIDRLDARRELEQLQNRLMREATGQSNEMAKSAIDWMQYEDWLDGDESLLAGQQAWRAKMQGVNLYQANLEKTDFYRSSLEGANLYDVVARNTNFAYTNLEGADFVCADLTGANLEGANLKDAVFFHPNQSPAILPDGKAWTTETEIERFTDPAHPDFWRSNSPESFAFIGNEEYWEKRRDPERRSNW